MMLDFNLACERLIWGYAWPVVWQTAWIMLIVAVACATVFRKAPPQVRYLLWGLVIVRALLPPTMPLSPLSLERWGEWFSGKSKTSQVVTARDAGEMPLPVAPEIALRGLDVSAAAPGPEVYPDAYAGLALAWGVGILVALVILARQWRVMRRLVRETEPAPEGLEQLGRECAQRMGLRSTFRLRMSEATISPLVTGIWRPVILVPRAMQEQLSEAELRAVLLHELAHVRRRDLLVNLFQLGAGVLFFFNPAMWVAQRRMRLEREQACDDLVLTLTDLNRQAYAHSLIKVHDFVVGPAAPAMMMLGVLEARGQLAQRMRRVLDSGMQPRARNGAFSAIILIAFTALFGTLRPHVDPLTMPMPKEDAARAKPIKLGIVVSYYTAAGPSNIGRPYGYEHALIAKSFNQDPRFELYGVLEPNALDQPEIGAILKELRISKVVNGFDAEMLSGLDVIVAAKATNLYPEMVNALSGAVRAGTSLLTLTEFNVNVQEELTPEALRLQGIPQGHYMFHPAKSKLRVMHEHPLFPELRKGDVIEIAGLNGIVGKGDGLSLLALAEDGSKWYTRGKQKALRPQEVSVMRVHQFGKGRVLNFTPWGGTLPNWNVDAFNRRMVMWLAARP